MPSLQATTRKTKGRRNNAMRAQGHIPAVVYGAIKEPVSLAVNSKEFMKMYRHAGESTIIDLLVGSLIHHVLVQDYQTDPLSDDIIHIDFRAIDMNKEIEANVKLRFVGESPAIKGLGGTLVESLDHVLVRCLPKDLPAQIMVDISVLKTFEDSIRIKDLTIPAGVAIQDSLSQTIATVEAPRTDEEIAALNQAVDVDVTKVELAAKKKEEEDAAAAAEGGAAPAEGAKPEAGKKPEGGKDAKKDAKK
ncbi:50S ribosomal protein L25 [Candidatus Uhrbacteria bacterium]|nr:50S ribosomal protein L25 [Candidatus Uhrbacteria bacterium]